MRDRLQEAITAAQAGQRAEARGLLMQVVEADERNETAWMWLAGVLDDPEEMRICLENVLHLNPANERAQQGLAWIDERYGPRVSPPIAPVSSFEEPSSAFDETIPHTPSGGKPVTGA